MKLTDVIDPPLIQFMNSKRHSNIRMFRHPKKGHYNFLVKGVRYSGVHRTLDKFFKTQFIQPNFPRNPHPYGKSMKIHLFDTLYKQLNLNEIKYGTDSGRETRWMQLCKHDMTPEAHGSKVDEDLGIWARQVEDKVTSISPAERREFVTKSSYSDMRNQIKNPDKEVDVTDEDSCSSKLMDFMWSVLDLIPIKPQAMVYNDSLKIATAVDLICTDKTTQEKIYAVEIKTSTLQTCKEYTENDAQNAVFAAECKALKGIPDTQLTKDLMQMMLNVIILGRSYKLHPKNINGILIKICKDGIVIVPMDSILKSRMVDLYTVLKQRRIDRHKKSKKR